VIVAESHNASAEWLLTCTVKEIERNWNVGFTITEGNVADQDHE